MNFNAHLTPINLYGIYELDDGGNIIYCGVHSTSGYFNRNSDLVGANFFDVAGFENVEDFRRRIKSFFQNSASTEDFNFGCCFSEGVSNIKVKLVRISERQLEGSSKKVIVDIRKI